MSAESPPFPLEGGRVGDGGGGVSPRTPSPQETPDQTPAARPVRQHKAPRQTARARRLRQEQPFVERLLWAGLRKLKMNFRRQVPIGPYVVDFAHHASRLVIEVDGYHHTLPKGQAADAARDAFLQGEGFRVLRLPEKRVRDHLFEVIDAIVAETAPPPSPTLPPSRGKGAPRYDTR